MFCPSFIERLSAKIRIGAIDECWPWIGPKTGGRSGESYGVIRLSAPSRKSVYAHRAMFSIANGISLGDMPRWLVVRHACDYGPCCNPTHLSHGDQQANADDMVARERSLRGELATMVKLTESDVHAIRRRIRAGHLLKDIAADYRVDRTTISMINTGRNWAWLETPTTP